MCLLDARRFARGDNQRQVNHGPKLATVSPQEANRVDPERLCCVDGSYHIRRIARRRYRYEHIAWATKSFDLTRKDLVIAEVVRDACKCGGVGAQGKPRQRSSVVHESAD